MKKILIVSVIAITLMFIGLSFSSMTYNIDKAIANSPDAVYTLTFQEIGIPINKPFSIYLYNTTSGYYNNTTVTSTGFTNVVSLTFSGLVAENYSWQAKNISTYKPNVKSGQVNVQTNTTANQLTYTLYTPYTLTIQAFNKPSNIEMVATINTSLSNGSIHHNLIPISTNYNYQYNQSFTNTVTYKVGNISYNYYVWTFNSTYAVSNNIGRVLIKGNNVIINVSMYDILVKTNANVGITYTGGSAIFNFTNKINSIFNEIYLAAQNPQGGNGKFTFNVSLSPNAGDIISMKNISYSISNSAPPAVYTTIYGLNFVLPNFVWVKITPFGSGGGYNTYFNLYYVTPSVTKTYNVNFTENVSNTNVYINGHTQSHNYYNMQLQNGTYNYTYAIQPSSSSSNPIYNGTIQFTVSGFSTSIYLKYYYVNYNENIFHSNIYVNALANKGKLATAIIYSNNFSIVVVNKSITFNIYPQPENAYYYVINGVNYTYGSYYDFNISTLYTNITAYIRNYTYTLTVNELGLPSSLQWTAEFNGNYKSSYQSSIIFNSIYGTFPLNISNVNNYAPNKLSQNISISSDTVINITFSEGFTYQFIPNIVSQYFLTIINSTNYKLTYTANNGNSISVLLRTGTYQYYANSSGYYEINGSIDVQQSLSFNLNFILIKVRYQYNFIPNIIEQYSLSIVNSTNVKTTYTAIDGNVISLMLLRTETYKYYANATGYRMLNGSFTVSKNTNFSLHFILNTAYKVTSYFIVSLHTTQISGNYYIYYSNGTLVKSVPINFQTFTTNYLVNGTYIITAYTNQYYIDNNSPVVLTVNGSNEYANISMIDYVHYTFYEYGIPNGTKWFINVNGDIYSSYNDIIQFRLPNNFVTVPIQIGNISGYTNNFTAKNITTSTTIFYVKFSVNQNSQTYISSIFFKYELYFVFITIFSSVGLIALGLRYRAKA